MEPSKKETSELKVECCISEGDNLTNTTFENRKIQIRSQEKQYVSEPEEKQKFDIDELLKSLPSENVSVKLDTLSNLSEFVSSADYSNCNIFSSLIGLMLNEEAEVRKQTLKIMENVLKKFSNVYLRLHYSEIKAYVNSAVTYINVGVRHDCLELLMLILRILPSTICKLHSLLVSVLSLISHQPERNMPVNKYPGSLLVMPNEQQSTLEWQNSVLKCIFTFLKDNVACVKHKPDLDLKVKFSVRQFYFNPFFPYRDNNGTIISNERPEMNFNTKRTAFEKFIMHLFPVLFEIWDEVTSPSFNDIHPDKCLETKTIILDIICLLSEWINYTKNNYYLERVLHNAYTEKIRDKFFQDFPYSGNLSSYENDRLCQIYCGIIVKAPHSSELSQRVSCFLLDSINQGLLKEEEMTRILQLLKNLLEYKNILSLYEEHLDALYLSIGKSKNQLYRMVIFKFFIGLLPPFAKLITKNKNTLIKVLNLIPTEFIKVSTSHMESAHHQFLLNILNITGYYKCGIQQGIAEHFQEIAELMASRNAIVSMIAVELIAKSQFISQEQFIVLASVIRQKKCMHSVVKCLFTHFTDQLHKSAQVFQKDQLLLFFLNLRFGQALREDAVQKSFDNFKHCIPFKLSSYTIVEDILPLADDFTDIIASSISHFKERKEVYNIVQQYLANILEKSHTISFHIALSVLKLAKDVMNVDAIPGEFWLQIADLNVGCFLYTIALSAQFACQKTSRTDPNHDKYIKLLNHTFNIGYLYKVLAQHSCEIKNINYAPFVEHLIRKICNASVEGLKSGDFKAIAIFCRILKTRFSGYFTEREWFKKLYAKSTQYL